MKSEVLIKINNFVKDRIIELSGILLILAGAFLSASILSYSPSDPNFIYNPDNVDIKNIGGFYGSVIADLLLQSVGLVSIFLIINLFSWGLKLISQKKIINFISRIFFTLVYIIFGTTCINITFNDSFWLIDNGNSGFVGRVIKEYIYNFSTSIENQYVVYCLILLAVIFFILSLNLKLSEIVKILSFPILTLFNANHSIPVDIKFETFCSIIFFTLYKFSLLQKIS